MRKFMKNLALPIAILVAASELNCLSTSVSLASASFVNDGNEGIHSITSIESVSDEYAYQELPVGSTEDDILLPDTITVTIQDITSKKVDSSVVDSSTESSEDLEEEVIIESDEDASTDSSQQSETGDGSQDDSSQAGSTQTGGSTDTSVQDSTDIQNNSNSNHTDTNNTDGTENNNTTSNATENTNTTNTTDTTGTTTDTTGTTETGGTSDGSGQSEEAGESAEPNITGRLGEGEDTSVTLAFSKLFSAFSPLTAYAATDDDLSLDNDDVPENADSTALSSSTVTSIEERVLENISWKIDPLRSTYDTFRSDKSGAKFVYVPKIPYNYSVDTELPTVTVVIVGEDLEPEMEYMALEKNGIKVEGNLPVGSELVVTALSDEEALELVGEESREVVFAYDISIYVDGEEWTLDESVKVTITPPSYIDTDDIAVDDLELIHVADDMTNSSVDVDINSEGEIEFTADGFSAYVALLGGTVDSTAEIELAANKTFSQSVKVTFSDASLIDKDTDTIKLSLYGNISKKATATDDGTTDGLILLAEAEDVHITSYTTSGSTATAYIEYTFSNIPVYVMAGTGDATAGGSGAYTMPSDFYGIQIETVSGYTPSGGTGEDYIKLSPVKDSNDAAWTTSLITITNSIMELASPSFAIEWQDNRNYAGMRPYSTGYDLTEEGAAEAAGKIELYYKDGDTYTKVDDGSSILVASGSNHPTVTMSSFSNWNVAFSSLPKYASDGTEYSWYIKPSNDFLTKDGTDISSYYNISGLNADGYLPISESTTNTLVLTFSDEITGTINWRVGNSAATGDSKVIPDLPSDGALFDGASMTLYSQTGSNAAVTVSSGTYDIKWEKSSDGTTWTYSISGLPLYASSGDAIVYYVVMGTGTYTYTNSSTTTDSSYKFTYDNGTTSTDTDKCYSGQNIYATLTGDAEFTFNKVWYDDNDDDSVTRRKTAIDKGITLYLWRYPINKGQSDGAPVTNNAKQYTYKFTEADAESQTKEISFADFSGDSTVTFAKYDEQGYEYVYYVTEVSESELYTTYYFNAEGEFDGTSTEKYVKNGGSICNVRSAKIALKVTKEWKVSSVSDYVSSTCELVLQRNNNDAWEDVTTLSLTGFSSSKKKVTDAFEAVDFYDGLGKQNKFRVIERTVTSGSGTSVTISDDSYTYSDTDDSYTAAYELSDYSYKVITNYSVSMTDGVESASCTVTNKLYGTKDLTIIKTWSGDKWGIGTDSNSTGDVSLTLKRAVDGGTASEYATIVLEKPDTTNELSGTGSFAITCDDTDVIANDPSYTISGSGKTWTTAAITVPAYTDDGEQYVYSIVETGVDTTTTYGKEYDKNVTGKKIELTVNNYTGDQTYMTRIDVSKVWKDDSDISQRSDVFVEFGYYVNGTFTPVKNSSTDNYYTMVLSSDKDYENHIWIHGEDFLITDAEKEAFKAATTDDVRNTLRAQAIADHLSIRASLYNDNRTIANAVIDSNGNLTGGVIPAIVDTTNSIYKPGYNVTVDKSDDGTNFTITNTRFASRSFTFTKTWTDSGNILGLRGDFLRVALFRAIGDTEEEVAYIDIPTYSDDAQTTLTSGKDLTVTFTGSGSYYPAYDSDGNNYSYSIKEYICTGTAVTKETQCTDGTEADTPTSKVEVDIEATKDTTTTGYVVTSSSDTAITYSSIDIKSAGTSTTDSTSTDGTDSGTDTTTGITSLLMTEAFGYTNKASGARNEVAFYVIWHDYAKSSQRPDLYYTLYYSVAGSDTIEPYTGEYTERWESVIDGNKYIQKVVYTGLPSADDAGNVYIYYVAETLNNAAATYDIDHYTDNLYTDGVLNTAIANAVDVTADDATVTQIKILDGSETTTSGTTDATDTTDTTGTTSGTTSTTAATASTIAQADQVQTSDGTYLTKEGSFTLITIADTVHVEGKKLWTNVPEGILADKLPDASIYLFRQSAYDNKNAAPTVASTADTKAKVTAYAASAVPEISSDDGSASPKSLNKAKALYAFGTYNEDGTVATYVDFPKYDELGYLYTYSVREIIYNAYGNELPSDIMQPSYSDNTADLTNVYQIESTTNIRSFQVTKLWDLSSIKNHQGVYAKATFRLYRMELDSDGEQYKALVYAGENDDASKIASSSNAATVFDISTAELVYETDVTTDGTTDGTTTSSTITWDKCPIFAPSGKIYAYYVLEMTSDMPGYTASVYGTDGTGATSGNTALSSPVTDSDGNTFIGVAFANSGITIASTASTEANGNLKTETFKNIFNAGEVKSIVFYKEWDSVDNEGNIIKPDIEDDAKALNITVKATASTQSGKDNADTITFTENTDYTLSVENVEIDNTWKYWKYTITFTNAAPVYSANGNLYTYTVSETLNSDFVKTNYKITTGSIVAKADTASDGVLTISNKLKNSLKGGFTVQKRWDDYSNDYGMREGSVYFKVYYRLGDSGDWTVLKYNGATTFELSSSNSWKKTFSALPASVDSSGANGSYYQYRVVETSIEQTDDTTTSTITVTEPNSDAQTSTWTQHGLTTADSDKFYSPVSAGNYLVYNPANITDISSSPSVKIVNQLDSDNAVTSLTVTKKWNDDSDKYTIRPTSITVLIQKSTDKGVNWTDVTSRTITSSAALENDKNTWTMTFSNLPKYYGSSASDQTYMYRAVETKVGSTATTLTEESNSTTSVTTYNSGYGGSYSITHELSGDTSAFAVTITNTLRVKDEAINVALRWNDDASSHEDINVALYSANFTGGTASSGVVTDESTLKRLSFTDNVQTLTDSVSSCVYSGLPEYNKDGELIVYYVKEVTTGDFKTQYVSDTDDWPAAGSTTEDALQYYESASGDSEKSFYVYVINTPLISITGSKVWSDSENSFGLRPDSLTFTLQRTNADSEGNIADNATWENVTVTEINKTNANPTGVSGASDGSAIITVSEDDSWVATISSLPLYKLGDATSKQRYGYRLAETTVPSGYSQNGYTYGTTADSDNDQTSAVTNTLLTREAITVEKVWNASTSEMIEVTVSLLSRNFFSGEDVDTAALSVVKNGDQPYTRTISATDNWKTVFEDLPSTNMDGNTIVYYIAETAGDGFYTTYYVKSNDTYVELSSSNEAKTDGTAGAATFRIINTPYASASVTIEWTDKSNVFGTRPENVYVKLQRRVEKTIEWTDVTWADIPDNATAADKIAEGSGSGKVSAQLNADGKWTITYDNLPLYVKDVNGAADQYEYRFLETDSSGTAVIPIGYSLEANASEYVAAYDCNESGYANTYTSGQAQSGTDSAVTGSYATTITNTLITKEITVIKNWEDESNARNKRPDSLVLYITEDTTAAGSTGAFNELALGGVSTDAPYGVTALTNDSQSLTTNLATSDDGNTWTYTISGLPRYAYGSSASTSSPAEMFYIVTEDINAEYSGNILKNYYSTQSSTEGDITTITNTGYENFVSLQVDLTWLDSSDKYGLRPEDVIITVQNSENGTNWNDYMTVQPISSTDASSSDSDKWIVTFNDLPEYKGSVEDGVKYSYRAIVTNVGEAEADISTDTLSGQGGAYSVTHANAFDEDAKLYTTSIENTLEASSSKIHVKKIWNDDQSSHENITVALYSANYYSGTTASGIVTDKSKLTKLTFTGSEVTLSDTSLEAAFDNLPEFNKDGNQIIYYVLENASGEYKTQYAYAVGNWPDYTDLSDDVWHSDASETTTTGSGNTSSTGDTYISIINTPVISAGVDMAFADDDNRYVTRPESVYVKLQQKAASDTTWTDVTWGDIIDSTVSEGITKGAAGSKVVFSLDEANDWTASFETIPLFKTYGGTVSKLEYRFIETDEDGTTVVPIGYTLTTGSDTYVESNDGTESGYDHSYDADSGYATSITNTLITKDLTVRKIWDDNNDSRKIRPDDITLYVTEDTSVTGTVGGFDELVLSGVSEEYPYGQAPLSNVTLGLEYTVSTDGNTWTYTFAGLPKYAYGSGASTSDPIEIVYKVTEDTETPDENYFIIRDKYETTYNINGDTTEITNTVYTNDGVLIIRKEIEKRTEDENETSYAFPFEVTLTSPDGTSGLFNGTYYLYDADEVSQLTASELRADAFLDIGRYSSRVKMTAQNGIVRVAAGKVAVLVNINTGCTYEVTEDPSSAGYEVYKVTNNSETCQATYPKTADGALTLSGGSSRTTVKQDEAGAYYAYASGKITGTDAAPCEVTVTNRVLDSSSHYLGIENVTVAVTDIAGNTITGGEVKTYKKYVVVDNEDAIGQNDYWYVNTQTPYVEAALAIEFEPDTANGYSYTNTLKVCYWEEGDDFTSEAPHQIVISGYVYTDSEGNQVPYTGKLVKNDDGAITVVEGTDEFAQIWSPLLAADTPYKEVTVLSGSVVVNLASDPDDMPPVTLIQVSFVAPTTSTGSGSTPTDTSDQGGDGTGNDSGDTTDSTNSRSTADKNIATLVTEEIQNLLVDKNSLKGVRTGDDNPIHLLAALFALFAAGFGTVLIILLRIVRKKK